MESLDRGPRSAGAERRRRDESAVFRQRFSARQAWAGIGCGERELNSGLLVRLLLPLQGRDETIYFCEELFLADRWVFREHRHGAFSDVGLAGLPRPAPHLTVGQQGKPTKIMGPARVVQVGQQVFESELNGS